MIKIEDGHYVVHSHVEGKDLIEGSFDVKDNVISHPNLADKCRLDRFPAGPIDAYTRNLIRYLMTTKDKDTHIEKV
jgi:hypothetical protein